MRLGFVFVIVLGLFACKNLKKSNELEAAAAAEPDTVVVVVEKPAEPKDTLAISFEKTPCFGRCPVYKIKVYKSGFAIYEGLNFTEKLGLYSYTFSKEQMEKIYQSAEAIGYFDLKSDYNDPMVTDLPSTISSINLHEKKHKIRARINVPEKLKMFHENLSVTLTEKDWKPYSDR